MSGTHRALGVRICAYDLSPEGVAVLERWLARVPDPEYFAEAIHDLYLLAMAGDDYEVDLNELPGPRDELGPPAGGAPGADRIQIPSARHDWPQLTRPGSRATPSMSEKQFSTASPSGMASPP